MSKVTATEAWNVMKQRVEAAEAREAKLREALEAIRDHKPDEVADKIDHDVENCQDCKRMEGHPISHGRCNEWYHQHYRIKGKHEAAERSEQYQMRGIARQALTETEDKSNG